MNAVKESQCRIVDKNRKKQNEEKDIMVQEKNFKRAARIIKQGRSFDNIPSTLANLLSVTKSMEESNKCIL